MLPGLHGKTLKNDKNRVTRQTRAQINPYTYIAKSSVNKHTKVCFEFNIQILVGSKSFIEFPDFITQNRC